MTTAYIVSGPESSGNRLVASILCRSGCAGEGSTNQPQTIEELPINRGPYALIKHTNLLRWIAALRYRGFNEVIVIVVVREPIANCRSMVEIGHQPDLETAYKHRTKLIADNCFDAIAGRAQLEIVTYEGLNELFLRAWLPQIGLLYVPGALNLPGQIAPAEIQNQNAKHYLGS